MFVNLPDKPMPPHYQSDDCRYVYRSLQAGESCLLIGIGSVGKSNLMQNLTRDDVKGYHLDIDEAHHLLTVYLDPHTLIHLHGKALDEAGASWAGYELMLSRLHRTLRYVESAPSSDKRSKGGSRRLSTGTKEDADTLTEQVARILYTVQHGDPVTRQSGLRHLEEALYAILSSDDRWRVAFLLDEISDFKTLPALFFQSLRGLRDQYKGRVMYIITSRTPLETLLLDLPDDQSRCMKEFTELFRDRSRYISPLDEESAADVVDRFIARYDGSYTNLEAAAPFLKKDVFQVTGGHVGLLRRSFRPAVQYMIDDETINLTQYLLRNTSVIRECETIIASLTDEERYVFYHAIQNGRIHDMRVWNGLFEKHMVREGSRGSAEFRMPLLGDYAMRNPEILVEHNSLK